MHIPLNEFNYVLDLAAEIINYLKYWFIKINKKQKYREKKMKIMFEKYGTTSKGRT